MTISLLSEPVLLDAQTSLATTTAGGLLSTAPPPIDQALALAVATQQFGFSAPVSRLSGERDSNFLLRSPTGSRVVLKFINAAESAVETDFQISLLRHLLGRGARDFTPHHVPALSGADWVEVRGQDGGVYRARAYSFLEGNPAARAPASSALRLALGHTLAVFDDAVSDFVHPGIDRVFLWDVMHLNLLKSHVIHIDDVSLRENADRFIDVFAQSIRPALANVRCQPIHNDLSQSNFVVKESDPTLVAGVLDFGDMTHAPLVCDLAIAASYQMADAPIPLQALHDVTEGFELVTPLQDVEREHLLDLVLARIVQRLVITEWRASQFPENRSYILRHNPQARRLLSELEPVWRQQSRHGRDAARLASLSTSNASRP
ncbi:phosphotransferase [Herbaspirillum sp. DW155]|uniref:phosphotransferase n=1 Tax=Herbaspirillum sp. DW155 TaxID=3095609 RepID=UPI00308F8D9E|nr:phosphotransferase [Herbaspirillum sp. DW155]